MENDAADGQLGCNSKSTDEYFFFFFRFYDNTEKKVRVGYLYDLCDMAIK